MQPSLFRALASIVLMVPTITLAVTTVLWLPTLPASIPVQWSANGVSATAPTLVLAAGLGAIAALASIIGVATVQGARSGAELAAARGAVARCGAFAGAACAVWTACATLSLGRAPVRSDDVGGLPLLALALGIAWAAVPALLLTAAGRRSRQSTTA